MNYIVIIFISIIVIHFSLYYLNIDIFELANQTIIKNKHFNNSIHTNNTIHTNNIDTNNTIDNNIEEYINELKNLNKYIDNES